MKYVVIVSAHPLVRLGLHTCLVGTGEALEIHEVSSFETLAVREDRFDLAIVDTRAGPITALPTLVDRAARLVLLTDVPASYLGCMMLGHGFAGLLHLEDSHDLIQAALGSVLRGGTAMSRLVALRELESIRSFLPTRAAILARHIALDSDDYEIARELHFDDEGVTYAKRELRLRLGMTTPRDLAAFALRAGVITLQEFIDSVPPTSEGDS